MKKNFETLEVGRRYRNRKGDVVKIVRDDGHENYPFDDEDEKSYTPEGNVWCWKGPEHNLIKLLPEEPTRSLAELEAKREELDREIEELKKNTQTLYCEAYLYPKSNKNITLRMNRSSEDRDTWQDALCTSVATFDLPFRKDNGKWGPAFEIVPK
jgi:FtsZ-binding cell division protein ZapB